MNSIIYHSMQKGGEGDRAAEHRYAQPYPYHQPYPYYQPPMDRGRTDAWIVFAVILIIVIVIVAPLSLLFLVGLPLLGGGMDSAAEEYRDTVLITQGGHWVREFWYFDDLEFEIEVTSGGNVDIYLMDGTQYANAYRDPNGTDIAFSALMEWEDRREVSATVTFENLDGEWPYCLVVDNRVNTLTTGDADPTGPVTVDIWVETTEMMFMD